MSLATKLGRALPRFQPIAKRVAQPTQSLNELRSQIWKLRSEYWLRKVTEYPSVVDAAKVEAKQLWTQKLTQPWNLTYREVAEGAVCGLQIFGAFCIGEIIGRGNIIGYAVGPDYSAEHH
eukprot:TRINITY_DN114211_c0_g1_i1.p2 TRINITY_DN114211_c0_g1~~TRINITY_DN114211_c0_g1_i1.p2  ORF type:complete len:135 (-),score=63.19 TRINITY_DN114211_c0_g1_i1:82-441(-)